jgi:hypothetical protein
MPPSTMGPITGRVEQSPRHTYSAPQKNFVSTNLAQKIFGRRFLPRKPTVWRAAFSVEAAAPVCVLVGRG